MPQPNEPEVLHGMGEEILFNDSATGIPVPHLKKYDQRYTVGGYTYYNGVLYYVGINEAGDEKDLVHYRTRKSNEN